MVDDAIKKQTEVKLQESLVLQGEEQQRQLDGFRANAARIEQELNAIEDKLVEEADLGKVQDRLLHLAKASQCTLKKASPRGIVSRDFTPSSKQNPAPGEMPPQGLPAEDQPFEIVEVGLALNVEGPMQETMAFLRAIQAEGWIQSTNQLTLRRDPGRANHLMLEMEIGFQCLHKKIQTGGMPIGVPKV